MGGGNGATLPAQHSSTKTGLVVLPVCLPACNSHSLELTCGGSLVVAGLCGSVCSFRCHMQSGSRPVTRTKGTSPSSHCSARYSTNQLTQKKAQTTQSQPLVLGGKNTFLLPHCFAVCLPRSVAYWDDHAAIVDADKPNGE